MATINARSKQINPELPPFAVAQRSQSDQHRGFFHALRQVLKHLVYIIVIAPGRTSYMPVEHLLNAPKTPSPLLVSPPQQLAVADETRDQLTSRWRESKLSELSFVGLTVRISPPYIH